LAEFGRSNEKTGDEVLYLSPMESAVKEKRCLVTRNRNDFIKLTLRFFSDHRAHYGVLIVPYTIQGDQFVRDARLLKNYATHHPVGLELYVVDFLPSK
jgi:hypothetical protein